jgi:hypothetical protein
MNMADFMKRGEDDRRIDQCLFDHLADSVREVVIKPERALEVVEGQSYTLWITSVNFGSSTLARFNLLFAGGRLVVEGFGEKDDEEPVIRLIRGSDEEIMLAKLL